MTLPKLHRFSLLLFAITLAMTGCTASSASADATSDRAGGRAAGEAPPPFTEVVYGNNYPKHVHFQSFRNKTYITLSATAEDEPYIWSVDHETGQWQGPVHVGLNQLPPADQHGNPSMVIDNEGYIHVWYGSHGRITSEQVYARSKRPGDISEWIHPKFETRNTYPMASVMSDGTICVLYRAGNHSMPGSDAWVIQKSSDNGLTWSDPRVIVQKMTRDTNADIYCVPLKLPGEDRIAIGASDEYLPGSTTRHSTSHVFLLIYDPASDTLHNVAGKPLKSPDGASIETLLKDCLVADYDQLGNVHRRISARPRLGPDGELLVFTPRGDPAGFRPRPDNFEALRRANERPGKPDNYTELKFHGAKHRVWRWDGEQWQARDDVGDPRVTEAIRQASVPIREAIGTWVPTLTNHGHRPEHPNARAVFYEKSMEGKGRAWLWGDAGFLAPPAPLSKAKVPISVQLREIENGLEIEATEPSATATAFTIPIANTLDQLFSVHVQAMPSIGEGWRIEGVPANLTLAPGESSSVDITTHWQPGTIRYPLPQFSVRLDTADPDGGRMIRRVSLDPPLVGTRPAVTATIAPAAPDLDGEIDFGTFTREPQVPALGPMKRNLRSITPKTEAWLAYTEDALHIAFRCREPDADALKIDATDRDAAVWQDDSVEVLIEPDGDGEGRDYRHVIVNAKGVTYDAMGFDNAVDLEGLQTATKIDKQQWTAEITIPWASLGLDGPPKNAGILLARTRRVTGSAEVFQFPISPNGNHQPGHFARLQLEPRTAANDPLSGLRTEHPRLLLDPDRLPELRQHLENDPRYQRIFQKVQGYADRVLQKPVVEYQLDGSTRGRLLSVSRELMRRVLTLGTLVKIDPDHPNADAYRDRLIEEVLTVCAFDDWGPHHFLDVAEMSLGVAVAYDWFQDDLTDQQKATIREALVEKGLKMALRPRSEGNWWITASNNWNQVCHGGMTAAALAVADDEPALALAVLRQAREHIHHALDTYAPDGVYTEGPGYWGYGTMYSILTAASLQTALGHDWGILDKPGFRESFTYQLHMIAPSGWLFNYSDCGLTWGANNTTKHYWLAHATRDRELFTLCWSGIQSVLAGDGAGIPRDFPLVLLWYQPPGEAAVEMDTAFLGKGHAEVAAMRSEWENPDAWYLGLKGGALGGHPQLDAGVFVLEHGGVRWAHDLGAERLTYMARVPNRWKMYRISNMGHNTLTIGGKLHDPDGDAELDPIASVNVPGFRAGVFDLTSFFPRLAESVRRTGALVENRGVLIQDEIRGAVRPVTWAMHSRADVTLHDERVTLEQDGERMHLWIDCDRSFELAAVPATPRLSSLREKEDPNEGVTRLEVRLPAGNTHLRVWFSPEGSADAPPVRWGEAGDGLSRFEVGGKRYTFITSESALPVKLDRGEAFYGRLLVEPTGENDDALRIVGGWLRDAEGGIVAADRLDVSAALRHLAGNLSLQEVEGDGDALRMTLPLRNYRFASPLRVRVEPAGDTGSGWSVSGDVPVAVDLGPGQSSPLKLRAKHTPGQPRYPLPQLRVEMSLPGSATANGGSLVESNTLEPPVVGQQPPLAVPRTATPPTQDGRLAEATWRRGADVPVLGRMDGARVVMPTTSAWLAYDDDRLYVAFRCEEPTTERLVAEVDQRDGTVYSDDCVEIMIEPDGDGEGRDYRQVIVNPEGVIYDGKGFDATVDLEGVTAAARVGDAAWTAEVSVPWASLGLDGPPSGAGILLARTRRAGGQPEVFQFPVSPGGNHQPSFFAKLRPAP